MLQSPPSNSQHRRKKKQGWTWRIISSSLSFLPMTQLGFYWLGRERKKLRNKFIVLRDHWIQVVLCFFGCSLVSWYPFIAQTWVGMAVPTIFMMNLSSLVNIIDFYYSLVVYVHSSMLISSLHRIIVVKLLLSMFLLQ